MSTGAPPPFVASRGSNAEKTSLRGPDGGAGDDDGPEPVVVLDEAVLAVTVNDAGSRVTFPAPSIARTRIVCVPGASSRCAGEVHGSKLPPSTLHSNTTFG